MRGKNKERKETGNRGKWVVGREDVGDFGWELHKKFE